MKAILLLIFLAWLNYSSLTTAASELESEVTQWQEEKEIDGEKVIVHVISKPVSTTFDAPVVPLELKVCEIELSTDYWQEDDIIKVDTVLENSQCGASKGTYTVRVSTRNALDESKTVKYQEAWSRDNSEPLRSIHTYSMNGDLELIRVRLQAPFNGACFCTDETKSAPQAQINE
ncbi:MAG: hypothetical protein ACJAQ6_001687 [Arenicella sp.]|jgi:hypothetical protein